MASPKAIDSQKATLARFGSRENRLFGATGGPSGRGLAAGKAHRRAADLRFQGPHAALTRRPRPPRNRRRHGITRKNRSSEKEITMTERTDPKVRRRVALALVATIAAAPLLGAAAPASAAPTAAVAVQSSTAMWARTSVQADLWTDVEEAVTRSGARRMRTSATYFPGEQRVVATTRTWNAVKLTGFTGGVQLVFLNADGRVIGATGMHTFGVDGTWIGSYDRTDYWEERIDAPWAAEAVEVRAVHSHAGRVRLQEIVQQAVDAVRPILELLGELDAVKPSS